MKHFSVLVLVVASMLAASSSRAQFRDVGLGAGIGFGGIIGATDDLANNQTKFLARAFVRANIVNGVQAELGAGLGRMAGVNAADATRGNKDGSLSVSQLVPVDARLLLSPFSFEGWNPYLYAGVGVVHYDMENVPGNADPAVKTQGWVPYAPGGLGLQFRLDDQTMFEMSGGYNYAFNDKLNAITSTSQPNGTKKDAYWNFLVGLSVAGESGSADRDGDGLTNREEKELGTDRNVADSDGDGLSDGEEVHTTKTNPRRADSDGDGLNDREEVVQHKTDANKSDTDGDALSDGEEVARHGTDPLKSDTDNDALNDGIEVNRTTTNPTKADTDGDGLADGQEVNQYKTDPLKADTDAGSVNDGKEVAAHSNPLNPSDDVPKKPEIKVEVGKAIVLDGIVFTTGSAVIDPQSEDVLVQAFNTLDQNSDVQVEIRGYTDNVGNRKANLRLSQRRADSVKAWLAKKGIAPSRMGTKGFGPDNSIADNSTQEGRQKNRRIEFFRAK
ncbi:MAG: OmpA family protein [Ignavibacteriae bacterium]|nr:OmpA family protein [Ignavibacteriota bacterium]